MTEALYYLILESSEPHETFPITQDFTHIGRSTQNDVVIDDPHISRIHARIIRQRGVFLLEDLNSTNGTFVNERRVVHPVVLQAGDTIRLGPNVRLRFVGPESDLTPTVAAPLAAGEAAEDVQVPMPMREPLRRETPRHLEYTPIAPPTSTAARPEREIVLTATPAKPSRLPAYMLWILGGVLVLLCGLCGGWLYWIDYQNLWCHTFFRLLLPGCW